MKEKGMTLFGQKCIVFDKNTKKILVLKRSSEDKFDAGAWDFVGGRVNFLEDNNDALKREAKEEANIVLNEFVPVDVNVSKAVFKPNSQFISAVWFCDNFDYIGCNIILSDEHCEFKWIDISELKDLRVNSGISRAYPRIIEFLRKYISGNFSN